MRNDDYAYRKLKKITQEAFELMPIKEQLQASAIVGAYAPTSEYCSFRDLVQKLGEVELDYRISKVTLFAFVTHREGEVDWHLRWKVSMIVLPDDTAYLDEEELREVCWPHKDILGGLKWGDGSVSG